MPTTPIAVATDHRGALYAATASHIRSIDKDGGHEIVARAAGGAPFVALACGGTGALFALREDGAIVDVNGERETPTGRALRALAIDDDRRVAYCVEDRGPVEIALATGQVRALDLDLDGTATGLALSPDQRMLYVGAGAAVVRVMRDSGAATLLCRTDGVLTSLAISRPGLCATAVDGRVLGINRRRGTFLTVWPHGDTPLPRPLSIAHVADRWAYVIADGERGLLRLEQDGSGVGPLAGSQ